jgi:hypothetical protein
VVADRRRRLSAAAVDSGDTVLLPGTLVAVTLNSRDDNDGWQPTFGNNSTEARAGGLAPGES